MLLTACGITVSPLCGKDNV